MVNSDAKRRVRDLARRHLAELEPAIEAAIAARLGARILLAMKAAARDYRMLIAALKRSEG